MPERIDNRTVKGFHNDEHPQEITEHGERARALKNKSIRINDIYWKKGPSWAWDALEISRAGGRMKADEALREHRIKFHPDKLPPNMRDTGEQVTKIMVEAYDLVK